MIFREQVTADIYNGVRSKKAIKRLPFELWEVAANKIDLLLAVEDLMHLRMPPSNKFERLKGDRKNEYSIRINRTYRICFYWVESEGAYGLQIEDYH